LVQSLAVVLQVPDTAPDRGSVVLRPPPRQRLVFDHHGYGTVSSSCAETLLSDFPATDVEGSGEDPVNPESGVKW